VKNSRVGSYDLESAGICSWLVTLRSWLCLYKNVIYRRTIVILGTLCVFLIACMCLSAWYFSTLFCLVCSTELQFAGGPKFMNYFWQRRGVVNGIDYGFTGEVKKIDVSRIKERLDSDSIVVVSNMGYSSSGEVLNCKYVVFPILYSFSWHINDYMLILLFPTS
jgi:hypothetical protein